MPYCPQCGVEYIESTEECSDCQMRIKPLATKGDNCIYCKTVNYPEAVYCWKCGVNRQNVDFDKCIADVTGEVLECRQCFANSAPGSEFCSHCGYLFTGARSCTNHPEIMTDHLCLICRRPVCRKCSKMVNEKIICNDDNNYHFVGNWSIVMVEHDRESLNAALKALEERKIVAVIKDQTDTVQSFIPGQYILLVPIISIKEAEKVLIEEKILYENVCTDCGYEFNGNPNRCPECGEEFAF